MPFTPYYTVKDGFGIVVFLILFAWFVFYVPNYLGHADNYIPANPLVTPAHIVPEWYFLPFYAILRAIPNKLIGVIAMFGSIAMLAFLPWLDTSKVRSALPAALPAVLLDLRRGRASASAGSERSPPKAAMCWRRRGSSPPGTSALHPGDPAAARPRRDAEAAAELDLRSGARQAPTADGRVRTAMAALPRRRRRSRSGCRRRRPRRRSTTAAVPPANSGPFGGAFGSYDPRAAAARLQGLPGASAQTCHGLKLIAFRNLAVEGGPDFSEAEVAAIAAMYKIQDGPNDKGDMFDDRAAPADHFPPPFPNDERGARRQQRRAAARHVGARQGAPVRARLPGFLIDIVWPYQELGPDYIVAFSRATPKPAGMTCRTASTTTLSSPAMPSACRRR